MSQLKDDDSKIGELAKLIGYLVLGSAAISVFFYLLSEFYYLFILAGGGFSAWFFWVSATGDGKAHYDKVKSAFFGFIGGTVAVTLVIVLFFPFWQG